ncbi:energy transducer TonB [Pseudomonas fontis]|uniref:Energy transducer TonB n=1 Tax=Pseudomonas fontis TaxID=2942633 RepID=A0ABT5NPU3_9PSED|nr:energy transducer TonB [Pseudomonas fontis]MDD0972360.1 energy transducer TonB [Pseudomonas fontis]MDD0990183.1 energy transducer TonB [Pseudomonas fontis]
MTDILQLSPGILSPVGDFSRHNVQTHGGASHLWQAFYAQALAEQQAVEGDKAEALPTLQSMDVATAEPVAGGQALAQIHSQRLCDVHETQVAPPEPLFLPIAEFEMELLDKPAPPFSAVELIEQQRQLDISNSWVRPVVMSQGHPLPEPGPAGQAYPLHLPIAEFEMDLLDKAPEPIDQATLVKQQKALEFDLQWARPVVLNNVRIAA